MKFLITAKPGPMPIPPERAEDLLRASIDWLKAKIADGTIDCVYNFFGGGGFSIGNGDSHEQVLGNMLEYPLYPFFVWEVIPILDMSESLEKYIAFYQKLASM